MVLFRFLLKEIWQGKLFCQSFSCGQLVVWIVGQSVIQSVSKYLLSIIFISRRLAIYLFQ